MKVYYDMDGTIADFNNEPNAMQRFKHEKGFFKGLKPLPIVEKLHNKDIYILSVSPNKQADNDKKAWIKKHLPNLDISRVVLIRPTQSKAVYAKGNVLIDDYTHNLVEWTNNGGLGIKAVNGDNNKGQSGYNKSYIKLKVR